MAPLNEAERAQQQQLLARANQLYEQFGKPLELAHLGEFVAIAPDGRTVLGTSAHEVGHRAKATFGPGNFVFKLGPRVVGKWR
jgi:hypothetical protein